MCLSSTVDSRCDLCSSKRKRRRDIEDINTSGYYRIRSKSFVVIPKAKYLGKEFPLELLFIIYYYLLNKKK